MYERQWRNLPRAVKQDAAEELLRMAGRRGYEESYPHAELLLEEFEKLLVRIGPRTIETETRMQKSNVNRVAFHRRLGEIDKQSNTY